MERGVNTMHSASAETTKLESAPNPPALPGEGQAPGKMQWAPTDRRLRPSCDFILIDTPRCSPSPTRRCWYRLAPASCWFFATARARATWWRVHARFCFVLERTCWASFSTRSICSPRLRRVLRPRLLTTTIIPRGRRRLERFSCRYRPERECPRGFSLRRAAHR